MQRSFLPTILLACALIGAFTIGYVLRDTLRPDSPSRGFAAWERNGSTHSSRRVELLHPRNVNVDGIETLDGRFRAGIPVQMAAGSSITSPTHRNSREVGGEFDGGLMQPFIAMPQLRTVAFPTFFVPVSGGRSRSTEKDEDKSGKVTTELASSYVVFGPEQNDVAFQSMKELLIGAEKKVTVDQVETLQEGIESKADVLILLHGRGTAPQITKELIEPFKQRKVIGIGFGAAGVFEAVGLKLGPSNIVFGRGTAFKLSVQESSLLDSMEAPVSVFDPPLGKDDRFPDRSLFAY